MDLGQLFKEKREWANLGLDLDLLDRFVFGTKLFLMKGSTFDVLCILQKKKCNSGAAEALLGGHVRRFYITRDHLGKWSDPTSFRFIRE